MIRTIIGKISPMLLWRLDKWGITKRPPGFNAEHETRLQHMDKSLVVLDDFIKKTENGTLTKEEYKAALAHFRKAKEL